MASWRRLGCSPQDIDVRRSALIQNIATWPVLELCRAHRCMWWHQTEVPEEQLDQVSIVAVKSMVKDHFSSVMWLASLGTNSCFCAIHFGHFLKANHAQLTSTRSRTLKLFGKGTQAHLNCLCLLLQTTQASQSTPALKSAACADTNRSSTDDLRKSKEDQQLLEEALWSCCGPDGVHFCEEKSFGASTSTCSNWHLSAHALQPPCVTCKDQELAALFKFAVTRVTAKTASQKHGQPFFSTLPGQQQQWCPAGTNKAILPSLQNVQKHAAAQNIGWASADGAGGCLKKLEQKQRVVENQRQGVILKRG